MRRRFGWAGTGRAGTGRAAMDRFWLASGLRLLSALCLLFLALAVFWQPLRRVARPHVAPVLQRVPVPEMLRPQASGFTVRVVSSPSAATVAIDGAERGSTPLFANVKCKEGQEVTIAVEKRGFPAWRRTVRCRVGGELTVQASLGG